MKHEKLLTALTGSLLSFAAAWGTVLCLVTAFSLPLERPELLLPVIGGFSLLSAAAFSLRRGGTILACLLALLCGYLWQEGTAWEQTVQLLCRISATYDRAYGWGVLDLTEQLRNKAMADFPMAILGSVIAILICRCICRQGGVWPGVLSCIVPLLSCIVVTDTVPDAPFLLLVMAALILLILPSSVRQENTAQGLRLTAYAALPVTLALLGLFIAVPQEGYVNHSKALQEKILTSLQSVPRKMETGMVQLASTIRSREPKNVNLKHVGPRMPFTYPVMEVTAGESGTLYLRGQDYDRYDGLGWSADHGRTEDFSRSGEIQDTLTIRTRSEIGIRYLPYYPGNGTVLTGGSAENAEKEREYAVPRSSLPDDWRMTAYAGTASQWDLADGARYLALPEETRQGAEGLLAQIPVHGSNTEKADIIAAFVTGSARYDLNTPRMPEDGTDFALWFLEESGSGYCIHFATAATVLLRAADVPARYVTGYMADVAAGEKTIITEENAHAWAEYFEPRLGCWIPLEATPGDEILPPPTEIAVTQPETEAPTESPETEAPAVSTEAAAETVPTAAEKPTEETPPPPEPEAKDTPWFALLLIPLLLLFAVTQRTLRLEYRRTRQRTGHPNAQALARWQEAERLSRLLKESPPEELMVLAQKAKFSRHSLTGEELQHFDSYSRSCQKRLKQKGWCWQLVYRYLYVTY